MCHFPQKKVCKITGRINGQNKRTSEDCMYILIPTVLTYRLSNNTQLPRVLVLESENTIMHNNRVVFSVHTVE